MQLDAATSREDPREKLRQLRAEFALKAQLPTTCPSILRPCIML